MKVLKIIIFVVLLGSFFTTLLVAINHYTTPIIQKNEELKKKRSVLDVFDISYTKENLEDIFSDNIEVVQKENKEFYLSLSREVAFGIKGSGVWGPIKGIIAFNPDFESIKGITIIHQEETPGLGGRISEEEYLAKFQGKKVFPALKIVPHGKAKAENEVDAITGATMTSKAFEELINNQVGEYLALIKEN
ncbi:MAG TPA: FMN-binding protein [Candidatus Omnitrophica bacterium]|nr:FMN-binding protein [Candidatus Omnitrophota bacterium]